MNLITGSRFRRYHEHDRWEKDFPFGVCAGLKSALRQRQLGFELKIAQENQIAPDLIPIEQRKEFLEYPIEGCDALIVLAVGQHPHSDRFNGVLQ